LVSAFEGLVSAFEGLVSAFDGLVSAFDLAGSGTHYWSACFGMGFTSFATNMWKHTDWGGTKRAST
jgi:hypothetical protein